MQCGVLIGKSSGMAASMLLHGDPPAAGEVEPILRGRRSPRARSRRGPTPDGSAAAVRYRRGLESRSTCAAVDLADRRTFLDGPPYEHFARLRREEPVAWVEHEEPDGAGYWVVTRWDDVMAVERDPETFSSNLGGTMIEPLGGGVELMMLNQDPPRHTRLKLLVSRLFTPKHIRSIEASIRTRRRRHRRRGRAQGRDRPRHRGVGRAAR